MSETPPNFPVPLEANDPAVTGQLPKADEYLSAPGTWKDTAEGGMVQTSDYGSVTYNLADAALQPPLNNNPYDRLVLGLPEDQPSMTESTNTDVAQQGDWKNIGTAQVFGNNRTLFERKIPSGKESVVLTDRQRGKLMETMPDTPFAHSGMTAAQAAELPPVKHIPGPVRIA